eukprot:TRINITY_DN4175_c3_g2_i1.p1 TRINITY_DN4175_c3_g2~~TRINITY_DN4175_c3_g2_i1.p1  ORF type:complete len:1453 (+),score=197.74 TRINITY_DN4175_c3_g2_i1:173-4360(+)
MVVGVYSKGGAGKSFFLSTLEDTFSNDDGRCYLPVFFNCWLFSDSNLWAALIVQLQDAVAEKMNSNYVRLVRLGKSTAFKLSFAVLVVAGVLWLGARFFLIANIEIGGPDSILTNQNLLKYTNYLTGASTVLGGILAAVLGRTQSTQMVQQMNKDSSSPDFSDKLGLLASVKQELDFISQLLNDGKCWRLTLFRLFFSSKASADDVRKDVGSRNIVSVLFMHTSVMLSLFVILSCLLVMSYTSFATALIANSGFVVDYNNSACNASTNSTLSNFGAMLSVVSSEGPALSDLPVTFTFADLFSGNASRANRSSSSNDTFSLSHPPFSACELEQVIYSSDHVSGASSICLCLASVFAFFSILRHPFFQVATAQQRRILKTVTKGLMYAFVWNNVSQFLFPGRPLDILFPLFGMIEIAAGICEFMSLGYFGYLEGVSDEADRYEEQPVDLSFTKFARAAIQVYFALPVYALCAFAYADWMFMGVENSRVLPSECVKLVLGVRMILSVLNVLFGICDGDLEGRCIGTCNELVLWWMAVNYLPVESHAQISSPGNIAAIFLPAYATFRVLCLVYRCFAVLIVAGDANKRYEIRMIESRLLRFDLMQYFVLLHAIYALLLAAVITLSVSNEAAKLLRDPWEALQKFSDESSGFHSSNAAGAGFVILYPWMIVSLLQATSKFSPHPAPKPTPVCLALFIDDLDRCSGDKMMQILQSIALLPEDHPFVTMLAIDPRVIVPLIESQLGAALPAGVGGMAFLDKIIQIPFSLPDMTFGTTSEFLVETVRRKPTHPPRSIHVRTQLFLGLYHVQARLSGIVRSQRLRSNFERFFRRPGFEPELQLIISLEPPSYDLDVESYYLCLGDEDMRPIDQLEGCWFVHSMDVAYTGSFAVEANKVYEGILAKLLFDIETFRSATRYPSYVMCYSANKHGILDVPACARISLQPVFSAFGMLASQTQRNTPPVAAESLTSGNAYTNSGWLEPLRPQRVTDLSVWLTCGLPIAKQSAGRYYHEVVLGRNTRNPQIGWLTTAFLPGLHNGEGVGDDPNGWAADGWRMLSWHGGSNESVQWERAWKEDDVIGCAIDLDSGKMHFSLNGTWNANSDMEISSYAAGCSFYPAATMQGMFEFRISEASWLFSPPTDGHYMAWHTSGKLTRPFPEAFSSKLASASPADMESAAMTWISRFTAPQPRRVKRMLNSLGLAKEMWLADKGPQGEFPLFKLAAAVVLSEQWPWRTSWMLQGIEDVLRLLKAKSLTSEDLAALASKFQDCTLSGMFRAIESSVYEDGDDSGLAFDADPGLFIQLLTDISTASDESEKFFDVTFIRRAIEDRQSASSSLAAAERDEWQQGDLALFRYCFNLNCYVRDQVRSLASKRVAIPDVETRRPNFAGGEQFLSRHVCSLLQ